jgi:hypothetical protein
MAFEAVAEALGGRPGYGSNGADEACALHVSVWRHPPDLP